MSAVDVNKDSEAPASGSSSLYQVRRPLSLAFFIGGLLCAFSLTNTGGYTARTISHSLMFQFRELIGQTPSLSPKIKVFALDDRAVMNGAVDYDAETWSKVIRIVADNKPSAILVNRSFAHQLSRIDSDKFNRQLVEAATPIFVAAPVNGGTAQSFNGSFESTFDLLNLEQHALNLRHMTTGRKSHQRGIHEPSWLPNDPHTAFGPEARISNIFTAVGHNLPIAFGNIQPLVNVGSTFYLAHWALQAARPLMLEDGKLIANGKRIPLDENNLIPVNLASPKHLSERLVSISEVLYASAQPSRSIVNEGDVVVILDRMANGTIDLDMTPIGNIPVNFVHLSLINSAVSGDWVYPVGGAVFWTLLFAFSGVAFAFYYNTRFFISYMVSFAAGMVAIAAGVFAWKSVILPWFYPTLAFVATASAWRIEVLRNAKKRATLLRHDFHGKLAPEKLQSMLESNTAPQLDAVEQVLTVMFIDIVGFSRSAEKQPPKEAFSSLKHLVDQLRTTVHQFGGVVDRTLGDGMLCVFGYDFATKMGSLHHAEQALECAARIQKDNVRSIIKALSIRQQVFPVRIGINTANVYLGNLGDNDRVDFTVIGNGVNFAQRLETACDPHMVMVGAATYDLVTKSPHLSRMLQRRYIKVKHSDDLVEAYELDPFLDEPALLNEGDEAYRQYIGVERSDNRLPVPYDGLIKATTNYGVGEITNFSNDGFTVKLSDYYAKGVMITTSLDSPDGSLGDSLESAGLASIVLEVRWAHPAGDRFVHGCLVKNLSPEQRDEIVNLIRDCIQRRYSDFQHSA